MGPRSENCHNGSEYVRGPAKVIASAGLIKCFLDVIYWGKGDGSGLRAVELTRHTGVMDGTSTFLLEKFYWGTKTSQNTYCRGVLGHALNAITQTERIYG